jgi:ligand-binding sensor domain-containing protein
MGVFLPEVFEKKAGTTLKVDFSAQLIPSQFTIKAKANVLGTNIVMLNASLFKNGLREVLGNRMSARQLDLIFKPSNSLIISQVEGVMNYENNFIRLERMNLSGLSDAEGVVADAQVTGSLAANTLIVHWDVDAKLSVERSRKLLKAAPAFANIVDVDGRIPFRFRVDGNIEKPNIYLAKAEAGR